MSDTLQLSNLFNDCWKNQRGVPGTAEELRLDHILAVRQDIGCIGFQQNSVQRDNLHSFPEILCPLFLLQERSADAKVITQFQILLCNFFGAIEAVNHASQFSGRVPSEDPQSILMGIANMENHWLLQQPRQIQLIEEPDVLLQPMLLLTLVVIVQATLTNGNHTGCLCEGIQFFLSDHFS